MAAWFSLHFSSTKVGKGLRLILEKTITCIQDLFIYACLMVQGILNQGAT
jgi:hypothetical protein